MASLKQKIAFTKTLENGGVVSKAMREARYSEAMAKNPQKLTESKGWAELMDEYLSSEDIAKRHKELLNSTKIEHMVFPLGPKDEDDINFSGARVSNGEEGEDDEREELKERTTLTDKEITEMLSEVNCRVRRIVHGETARHVYYWAADNKARKDAIDMGYKLKGSYAPEKSVNVNIELEADEEIKKLTEQLNGIHRGASLTSNGGASSPVGTEVQDKD